MPELVENDIRRVRDPVVRHQLLRRGGMSAQNMMVVKVAVSRKPARS
jgi:hypothetical protein